MAIGASKFSPNRFLTGFRCSPSNISVVDVTSQLNENSFVVENLHRIQNIFKTNKLTASTVILVSSIKVSTYTCFWDPRSTWCFLRMVVTTLSRWQDLRRLRYLLNLVHKHPHPRWRLESDHFRAKPHQLKKLCGHSVCETT